MSSSSSSAPPGGISTLKGKGGPPSAIFRRGGLTLDNWVVIGRFLYPEDLITLRAINKMCNKLFPHLIQILLDLWIAKVGSAFPLAELEADMMNFFIGPTYEKVRALKDNYGEGMEQFLAKISEKRFVKPIWRPYIEAILLLLRCYESITRGRAKANLGWWYDVSIFGAQAFDRNQHQNFKKIKFWFGGLDSRKKVRGKASGDNAEELEEQQMAARSQTAKIFSKTDLRKYYSVGKGSAFDDWTWLDFRELEPSLCASYMRYTEFLRQLLAQKRRTQEAVLLEGAGEEESSPQMKGMNDMERAAHVDKIRKREQDRKAAYGTLDEPPDELVAVGEAAVNWVYEAIKLFNRFREPLVHCRFLISLLSVAQMGMAVLEFTEPQMLVLNSARFLTRSLFSLRRSHLQEDVELSQLTLARGDPTPSGLLPYPVMERLFPECITKADKERAKQNGSLQTNSSTTSSSSEDFLSVMKTKKNYLHVSSAGYPVPSPLVLRTFAPRPFLNDFRFAEAGTTLGQPPPAGRILPHSDDRNNYNTLSTRLSSTNGSVSSSTMLNHIRSPLGLKFRKHARRTYVAIQVANMFIEWYRRYQRMSPQERIQYGRDDNRARKSFARGRSSRGSFYDDLDGDGEGKNSSKAKGAEEGPRRWGFEFKPKKLDQRPPLCPPSYPRIRFLGAGATEQEGAAAEQDAGGGGKISRSRSGSRGGRGGGTSKRRTPESDGEQPGGSASASTAYRLPPHVLADDETGPPRIAYPESDLDRLISATRQEVASDLGYREMVVQKKKQSPEDDVEKVEDLISSSKEQSPEDGGVISAEDLSDLITAAVLENSLKELHFLQEAVSQTGESESQQSHEQHDISSLVSEQAVEAALARFREQNPDLTEMIVESIYGSKPSSATDSENRKAGPATSSSGKTKKMRKAPINLSLPEVVNADYRAGEDFKDRILTLGSHLGPYARGHLVTAENNDSVNTVLNSRPAGKKARKPIKNMVDMYVLPKLYPGNIVGHKVGRQPVATRMHWTSAGQAERNF